jgi:hypothetical protein
MIGNKWAMGLALLFVCNICLAHEHEHQVVQTMNVGTASILDGQRQALLHAAELGAAGIQSSFPDAFVSEAKLFKAEFATEIENFNRQQQIKDPVSAKQGMDNFYAWRDSRVGNHWVAAESKMTSQEVAWLERQLKGALAQMRSTNAPVAKVASLAGQFPPNNGSGYGCGPDVSCNITYSLAMSSTPNPNPAFPYSSPQIRCYQPRYHCYLYIEMDVNDSFNPIIDGGTTMNCPPACGGNPVHTPSVQVQYNNGATYSTNGSSTCGNCYIYASGTWTFAINWLTPGGPPGRGNPGDGTITINDGGAILCTVAGQFVAPGKRPWLYEEALTMTHTHSTVPFSTTRGTWVYPDFGAPRNFYNDVSMGYYTQDNYCTGLNLHPPVYPDADMTSYLLAVPQIYMTGGVMLSSGCGHSGQIGCPIVPQEGIWNIDSTILWHLPFGNQWYVADAFWVSDYAYPNWVWERPLHFWAGFTAPYSPPGPPSCTYTGLNSAHPINDELQPIRIP